MKKTLYGVYGAGGFGRQVLPLAREMLSVGNAQNYDLVFILDEHEQTSINESRALTWDEFVDHPAEEKYATIAIANSKVREHLANRLTSNNVKPWTVQALNVTTMDDVTIEEGAILSSYVHFTSNIKVGKHFHANYFSYIAHDCVIGDFVTFAPRVSCNGNIIIKDHAYIGTGAVLRQGTPDKPLIIGENAIVGMGAVVTKDVPPNTTVVGNPARTLKKR